MDLPEFVIAPKTEGKGRAFRALRVHAVMADSLWDAGKNDKRHRPIMAAFAASDGELRPFIANLLSGREAVPSSGQSYGKSGYEFLRSASWAKPIWMKFEEGSVCTIYLKDLCDHDPGMVDPKGVKLVAIPGLAYLKKQAAIRMPVEEIVAYARRLPIVEEENSPERDHRGHVDARWKKPLTDEVLAEWVPLAYLFAEYLANRSRAPMPPDGKFFMQLMIACLKRGLASFGVNNHYDGRKFGRNEKYKFMEEGGSGKFAPAVAFMAEHSEIEQTLAAEISTYFSRTEGK